MTPDESFREQHVDQKLSANQLKKKLHPYYCQQNLIYMYIGQKWKCL